MEIKKLCLQENKTIKEGMNIIDRKGLGIAFVIDKNEKLIGVLTDGDIRRAILKGMNLSEPVKSVVNKDFISVNENWHEQEIKELLKNEEIKIKTPEHGTMRIPVINKENHLVDFLFASEKNCKSYLKETKAYEDKQKLAIPVKKVLVVGGAGYLGSVLCRKLLERGYMVRVLDNLTYGNHGIKDLFNNKKFEFLKGDMRNIQTVVDAVKDIDGVIHLAAIVGDPASALDPEETIEINYLGTRMLAEVCKYSQINRFVFASTCSVYGASETPDQKISETSKLNPISLYAEMKLRSEQGILDLSDENFSPTIMRMATLHGLSPRMRFDLVVNTLTIRALMENKITIFGGEQWRPNLHVSDAADAYINCLEQPIDKIKGEIFNVGSTTENYKIIEIGEMIKTNIPQTQMIVDHKNVDKRDYNVSFNKIQTQLNYNPKFTIEDAIVTIQEEVNQGKYSDYSDNKYSNYRFLQDLQENLITE